MLASPQNPDHLRLLVDSVMSSTDSDLISLFSDFSGDSGQQIETIQFIRDVSALGVSELRDEQTRLANLLLELRRKLEAQLISADRSALPCLDSIDAIIKQDVRVTVSQLASLEISIEKLNVFNSYKEEKLHIRNLLNASNQLQDLVDIPVLFGECLSRSYFAEALSLSEFFDRTMKHYCLSDVAIFADLAASIAGLKQSLISAVEHSLSTKNLKLQEASDLLLVYRMIFPTDDLKLKFLEFRGSFIRSKRIAASNETGAKRMKDKIECLRLGLSELLNQFKVLFSQSGHRYEGLGDPSLSRLVIGEIDEFLGSMASSLSGFPPESAYEILAEVYHLISYLKLFQFNPVVNSISHQYVCTRVDRECRDLLESFKLELSNYNWKPFTALIQGEDNEQSHIIHLTRHKPVAVLYNEVISILNGIRLFPLISCHQSIVLALDRALYSAFELLSAFPSAPSSELSFATRNFCLILIPTIEKYISSIYDVDERLTQLRAHPRFTQGAISAGQRSQAHEAPGIGGALSPTINVGTMQN